MKDTNGKETKLELKRLVVVTTDWTPVSVPSDEFSEIDAESISNIYFGFDKNRGAGSISLDDILFVPQRVMIGKGT